MRTVGLAPAALCRSEAWRARTYISRSAKSKFTIRASVAAPCCSTPADRRPSPSASGSSPAARHARDLGDRGTAVLHLVQAVVAQSPHAVADRDLGDLVGRGA